MPTNAYKTTFISTTIRMFYTYHTDRPPFHAFTLFKGEAMLIPLLLLLFALMHSGTKHKEAIHRYPFQFFSFAACGGSPRVVRTAECSLSICISEMMRSISAVCSGWSLSNCSKARSTRVSICDTASDSL